MMSENEDEEDEKSGERVVSHIKNKRFPFKIKITKYFGKV